MFFTGRSLFEDLPEDKEAKRRIAIANGTLPPSEPVSEPETPVEEQEEIHEDTVEKNPVEDSCILHERAEKILSYIDSEWKKKSDPMLSELLTIFILEKDFNIKDLVKYTFINKEICAAYSKDHDHNLPQDQEIAAKHGLTKSAVSKKLSRFFEPFKEHLKNL